MTQKKKSRLGLSIFAGLLAVGLFFWWMTANYPEFDFNMLIGIGIAIVVIVSLLNLVLALTLCLVATPVILFLARGNEELPYPQAVRASYGRLFGTILRRVPIGM